MISEIKFTPLIVADSLSATRELAERVYRSELPGFQVEGTHPAGPGVVAVMDQIEDASEAVLGKRIPIHSLFDSSSSLHSESQGGTDRLPPHIDGNGRGLSIHQNIRGSGTVQLAHPQNHRQPGSKPIRFESNVTDVKRREEGHDVHYKGPGFADVDVPIGTVHAGEIEPGKLTVFSRGNLPALKPTIHFFDRGQFEKGDFRSYESRLDDGELALSELERRAEAARREIVHRH